MTTLDDLNLALGNASKAVAQLATEQATKDAALAKAVSDLSASVSNATNLQTQLDAAKARIKVLEAQVNPPAPVAQILWGVNASSPSDWTPREAAFGASKLQAMRYYHQPGEGTSWPHEMDGLLKNRSLVYSSKTPKGANGKPIPTAQHFDNIVAGKYDAEWLAFFKACPTDRPTYAIVWHEPEDNVEHGEFTAAQYNAAHQHVANLARSLKNPQIKMTICLMAYTVKAASKRNWKDFYPGDAYVDVISWDPYLQSATDDPTKIYDAIEAASKSVNKPWAVAETGILQSALSGQVQYDALKAMASALKGKSPVFVCYFDNNYWQISDDPKATAAWNSAQS